MKLKFTRYAWDKLVWFRDKGNTEIGGWGITDENDPFLINDFQTVKQDNTVVTVEFDDDDNARFVHENIVNEIYPFQCQKIWIHTHPGSSAHPSSTDEETLRKMCETLDVGDHVVMYILAKGGEEYARLVVKTHFGFISEIMETDLIDEVYYDEAWEEEFKNINPKENILGRSKRTLDLLEDRFTFGEAEFEFPNTPKSPARYGSLSDDIVQLESADLAEEIYVKYDVQSVNDLNEADLKSIRRIFGSGIEMYLPGLEEEFIQNENLTIRDLERIYKEFEVSELSELGDSEWEEVMTDYKIRMARALDLETEIKEEIENERQILSAK